MRIDYLLYLLAAVFFITTAVSLVFLMDQIQRSRWVVTTIVLGLASIGLGYHQRPRAKMEPIQSVQPNPQSELVESGNVDVKEEVNSVENAENQLKQFQLKCILEVCTNPLQTVEKSVQFDSDLTFVKGIGERMAAQLKERGINSLDELAKVSTDDLAKDLGFLQRLQGNGLQAQKNHKSRFPKRLETPFITVIIELCFFFPIA